MFSIVIPSYNNIEYLKICLSSIKKNSNFNHEIIIHINEGTDGTLNYVKANKFIYTYAEQNVGLCSGVNKAASKASTNYILYSHDDMYFCPGWDVALKNELDKLNHNLFYFSATMIEQNSGHIQLDCGENYINFNEKKLLSNFNSIKYYDYQGSHWSPHLIHKKIWNMIGGFSEEFNPGIGSDPDLNMKLWKHGVRIFKGLSNFRVYHFGSISLRKKKELKRNKGSKTFLVKWGISVDFFLKYYLKCGKSGNNKILENKFDGPLKNPKKSISYIFKLFFCKLNFIYNKYT